MGTDFDRLIDRRGSGCFKYDALKMMYQRDDILSLWVADMDFAVSPQILDALSNRLRHPVFGYNLRMKEFYDAAIFWAQKRYNWSIQKEWMICPPGVVPAINLAVLAYTEPGDKVLIQPPVYQPFFDAVTAHKRQLLTNPLILCEDLFVIDYDDLEAKLKEAKLFIFCSPHNPVGRVWTEDELLKIGRLCRKHGVKIVSDDIHADLLYPPFKHIPIASLEDFGDFTITCISPSKSFNIAGLGTAITIASDPELKKPLNDLNMDLHLYLGNSFGISALIAAYTLSETWLEELLVYLQKNRDYVHNTIKSRMPMLKTVLPESTFLTWIDFGALGLNDDELFDMLTNKAGVALDPGTKYGVEGSGFMRLNFGCPQSIVAEALAKIERTINSL